MLEKDVEKRISSKDALDHPAFHSVLSKSPLIMRSVYNTDGLAKHQKIVEDKNLKNPEVGNIKNFKIPDRIEDMSPLPSPNRKNNFDNSLKSKNMSVSPDFH
jgi:hypothetical protein